MTIQSAIQLRHRFSITWLRSPWAILISAILGGYIGSYHPVIATAIAPIGELYLGLLKMCVFPILLSAITTSIGRLMASHDAGQYIRRILIVFPIGLLLTSVVAMVVAMILGPGRNLSEATLDTLGVVVNSSGIDLEMSLTGPLPQEDSTNVASFFIGMVPDNIFTALSEGQTLKVLVFAIVFGVSLGFLKENQANAVFEVLDAIFQSFNQLIQWFTLILPFGLCSLLAYQLSRQGTDVMFAMINFIGVALTTFCFIYIINTLVIWQQSKQSIWSVLLAVREPVILALATSSSLACLPSAISRLSSGLRFKRQTVNLVTPLSITLCRFGSVIYFALGTIFVAQLYQTQLGITELIIVLLGTVFAGMATSGVTGVLTLTMLGLVLEPLQLPLEAVLVLFIAIDPLIDPFRTLGIVYTGMATTAVIADLES
ncbi:MAG: cation:dicarboxylase symporter family transporter [Cyanobacteria bacterium J06626_14]